MSTVTLCVADREASSKRVLAALAGESQGAFISFESPELLWKVLTARRWAILKTMAGAGPLGIRETARRVGRDVKAVHRDVHALLVPWKRSECHKSAGQRRRCQGGSTKAYWWYVESNQRGQRRRWPVKLWYESRFLGTDAGVIERGADGRIVFPYDAVRVDFELRAA